MTWRALAISGGPYLGGSSARRTSQRRRAGAAADTLVVGAAGAAPRRADHTHLADRPHPASSAAAYRADRPVPSAVFAARPVLADGGGCVYHMTPAMYTSSCTFQGLASRDKRQHMTWRAFALFRWPWPTSSRIRCRRRWPV